MTARSKVFLDFLLILHLNLIFQLFGALSDANQGTSFPYFSVRPFIFGALILVLL